MAFCFYVVCWLGQRFCGGTFFLLCNFVGAYRVDDVCSEDANGMSKLEALSLKNSGECLTKETQLGYSGDVRLFGKSLMSRQRRGGDGTRDCSEQPCIDKQYITKFGAEYCPHTALKPMLA